METDYVKKTKIVCTIGPSSWDPEVLKKMVANGMNVARINGAFADLAELERVEGLIRAASEDVALMLDIKGHEVRLNKFEEPIPIKPGQIIEIGNNDSHEIYPITFPDLYKDVEVGTVLIFDDGNVESIIREISGGVIKAEIVFGELFKPGKSINTPGVHLSNPALTERDKEQMHFVARERRWEFVAASFIRGADDAKAVVAELEGTETKVIAKIEDNQGVENIDDILEIVEGIMVARGDLGVEVPFERVPLIQKELIWKANMLGKPVITATQMLESMTEKPRPTRAEITDVANAIIDGTDAIMLSGESSAGKFPAEAVGVMNRIAVEVEPNLPAEILSGRTAAPEVTDALTKAAFQVAFELEDEIKAIIVVSITGRTARLIGRFKLAQPVYAFVSEDIYRRRLAVSRGVTAAYKFEKGSSDRDKAIGSIMEEVIEKKLAGKGDKILLVGNGLSKTSYFPNLFEVVDVSDYMSEHE